MQFLLVLGHSHLGAIPQTVQCIRQAMPVLRILVILNEEGAEYPEILAPQELLRSKWVNVDHDALAAQVIERIQAIGGQGEISVAGIVNVQDFMWPCFLDMCDIFPMAKQYPPKEVVLSTAVRVHPSA